MPGLLKRWVKFHEIIGLRHGPAAAILPPEVTRIHLNIGKDGGGGHMGGKKFWKLHLPQLKYHNPSIPMIINRHEEPSGPSTLSVYIRKENAADATAQNKPRFLMTTSWLNMSKAPEPLPEERVATIDMKHRMANEILDLFLAETNAKLVTPMAEEQALLEKFAEEEKKLKHDQSESMRLKKEREEESEIGARAKALALGTA